MIFYIVNYIFIIRSKKMTNNLRNLQKDLRAFAKKTKDFKYTDSALVTFLMTGVVSITSNLFSQTTDKSTENQKQEISSSIKSIHQKVKETRRENSKLLKSTNLELIQLMEQGDHVVKSPWSSWQYGINYFNNNWNGTYKGRGDKKEKYPYEGVFERSSNIYERAISPDSSNYGLLDKNRKANSASGSAKGYGIASVKSVKEPIIPFEVRAGIRPRNVNKSPIVIAAKSVVTPTLPETISFTPPKPVIGLPELPELPAPPTFNIQLGSYCNYMADCGSSVNGGAYNYDFDLNAFSVLANAPGTKGRLRDGYPSLRHSWNNTGSVLLKSYFDTETNYNLTTNLTVNSENPLNETQKQSERNAGRGYNAQNFLVGGSRAATMDNAPANTELLHHY